MNDIPDKWAKQLPSQEYVKRLENQLEEYKNKCNELEQKIEHLRVSRRVLMNLLEKVEREKVANEKLLNRRVYKEDRPFNPFKVIVDNSKTLYLDQIINKNIPNESYYKEEKYLTRNPNPIFDEIEKEEGIKIIHSRK